MSFNRNVPKCAYGGSVGVIGATTPGAGKISTAALATNVNGVLVRTFSKAGAAGTTPSTLLLSS